MKKVLVIEPIHAAGLDMLSARGDVEYEILVDPCGTAVREAVRDAHGITVRKAPITRDVIAAASRLEIVSRHGVGYDAVDVACLTERRIPLAIAIHANAVSVAEHALFMLMALAKQALAYDRATRRGEFGIRYSNAAFELYGKRLLILGFGRTGSQVAPRARALGVEVLAADPYVDDAIIESAGCEPVEDWRGRLDEIDMITVHCPLTTETRDLISDAELAVMKPGAVVVNCARGGIVNEDALHRALVEGRIAGAGLDVFTIEPAPAEHPLFALDNVIVSPHSAGVTAEAGVRMATGAVRNVLDAFDGCLDPAAIVNPEVL